MNDVQRANIEVLRAKGVSYRLIAKELNINENTIKTYCRRHGLGGVRAKEEETVLKCLNCGKEVKQNKGRKIKKFCCDKCRNKWWNNHLDQVNRKANHEIVCAGCGKVFTVYGSKPRKYCTFNCYILDRFGGGRYDDE
jgi:IS30 family transposase